MSDDVRERFRALHADGLFLMPNPWDVGSARLLEALGFPALATTSSGHAWSMGRLDQHVARDELLAHAGALASAVDVPLNVDAERCFGDDPDGVADTVRRIADTGAAGCSIEDYDPVTGRIDPIDVAVERVAAAAEAARESGLVLTARAENHIYGVDDIDDTITRLCAYRDAGAEVVYAPWLTDPDAIARVVREVGVAVNVLAVPAGPPVPALVSLGVRRVSTGGTLARAAYGTLVRGARELLDSGTTGYATGSVDADVVQAAFR